jgi:hypothetical protein
MFHAHQPGSNVVHGVTPSIASKGESPCFVFSWKLEYEAVQEWLRFPRVNIHLNDATIMASGAIMECLSIWF